MPSSLTLDLGPSPPNPPPPSLLSAVGFLQKALRAGTSFLVKAFELHKDSPAHVGVIALCLVAIPVHAPASGSKKVCSCCTGL